MWHHPQYVPAPINNTRDTVYRPVRIIPILYLSFPAAISEYDLIIPFEFRESFLIDIIIPFVVRYGYPQNLTFPAACRKPCGAIFRFYIHILAYKMDVSISDHGARKKPGFEPYLKTIADTYDKASSSGKIKNRLHYGRKPGNRACP